MVFVFLCNVPLCITHSGYIALFGCMGVLNNIPYPCRLLCNTVSTLLAVDQTLRYSSIKKWEFSRGVKMAWMIVHCDVIYRMYTHNRTFKYDQF